ncbi:MAG TPA: hypothetical protein VFY68_00910 [Nitrososphaeraceae archaeon]|nr:hypothetical protein [Nitrososphaeraceae archaeon]
MNNKAILLFATAFLAFLMIGGIGFQIAEASGPNCPSKGGAAAIVDPNAPNAVNTDAPVTPQPVL